MLLFYNGIIHTMDAAHPTTDAVLVGDDGRIASSGAADDLRAAAGRAVDTIDLRGRTLIPGFNDAHVHVQWLGTRLTLLVDITGSRSMRPLLEAIAARAAASPPREWISASSYNENFLAERRHPTRHDLDAVSGDHPVVILHTSGHQAVANSAALALAGITRETPDPSGGHIDRDSDGEPTGLLEETALPLVYAHVPEVTAEQMRTAILAAMQHQLSLGITSATDPAVEPPYIRVYQSMDAAGELAVRVNLLAERRSGDVIFPLPERCVSDRLRIDSVKFFADGGMTSATAAISTPYKETGTLGILIYDTEMLADLMWEAHDAGLHIATHANGDRALEQVITIYEMLHARKPQPELRHRIEHLALPTAEHLQRLARLGVMTATQTVFLPVFGAAYRRYMPDHYIPHAYGLRDMLNAGIDVALSTDAPVVPDDNPLIGIKAAVDRLDHEGKPLAPDQAITPYEALYAYTMGGAILSGDQANRGSLTPGKWADMAILSGDPLNTPTSALLDLGVEATYVEGRCVYGKP